MALRNGFEVWFEINSFTMLGGFALEKQISKEMYNAIFVKYNGSEVKM